MGQSYSSIGTTRVPVRLNSVPAEACPSRRSCTGDTEGWDNGRRTARRGSASRARPCDRVRETRCPLMIRQAGFPGTYVVLALPRISISGYQRQGSYGLLSKIIFSSGLKIGAKADKNDVVLINVAHRDSKSAFTRASSPFSYSPPGIR